MPRTTLQASGYDRTLQRIANGLPSGFAVSARPVPSHLPRLPADQRNLCIGVDFEYEALGRWERIAAS